MVVGIWSVDQTRCVLSMLNCWQEYCYRLLYKLSTISIKVRVMYLKSMYTNVMGKPICHVFCEDEGNSSCKVVIAQMGWNLPVLDQRTFCDTKWYPTIQRNLTGLELLMVVDIFPFHVLDKFVVFPIDAPIPWASRIQQQTSELLYTNCSGYARSNPFHVYGAWMLSNSL